VGLLRGADLLDAIEIEPRNVAVAASIEGVEQIGVARGLAGRPRTPLGLGASGRLAARTTPCADRNPGRSRRRQIERRIVRSADAIVASTEYERAALVEGYGARSERVSVVPAGVDLRQFQPIDRGMARAALDLKGEVLLFVGRLDPVKGVDTLLQAVKLLAHRPALRLLIAGGSLRGGTVDADEAYLRNLARELGIADRVEWLGPVKGSHSPPDDAEPGRRALYQHMILSGRMKPDYACDNDAGIYFEDDTVKRVVSTRPAAKVYHVSVEGGKVVEKVMEPERIE
jgi:glycosyltransferase involved in cell wall biosynthesis